MMILETESYIRKGIAILHMNNAEYLHNLWYSFCMEAVSFLIL